MIGKPDAFSLNVTESDEVHVYMAQPDQEERLKKLQSFQGKESGVIGNRPLALELSIVDVVLLIR